MALTVQNRHYIYANWISSKNIRPIHNDLEWLANFLVSKQIDSAAYVHTLSTLFVEVL